MRTLAAFFVFLSASLSLFAQTPQQQHVDETIVVTADRTTEPLGDQSDSVTVITAQQLRVSQTPTVIEALRDVAGISVMQSGSPGHTSSIFLRGANPAQVLVLVDGIDVNNPFFGGVDLSSMLTSGIERIEVVRGPQSPLYGTDAMAGVINIITGANKDSTLGTVNLEGGSHSTQRESVQLGEAHDKLHWSIAAGHIGTDGQFTNDEFRSTQLNGRIGFDLTPTSSITIHSLYNDSHIGIPFNGATPSPERNSDATMTAAGAGYSLHASPLANIDVRGSWTGRHDDFHDPLDAFSKRTIDDSKIYHASVQNLSVIGAHTLTVGAEQQNQDVTGSNDGVSALDEHIRNTSLYAQDKFQSSALMLTAGARWDHHNSFGTHVSPRLSAAVKLAPSWRLRAAAGSAFRAPSAGELAYPFYGNPDLKPETNRTYEAGLDFATTRSSLSLTAFQSKYHQLITFDPVTFIAGNVDRASIRGAELTAGVRFGEGWRANAAYTLLQTRNDVTGLALVRRPRNLGTVTLAYDTAAWGLSTNVIAAGRRLEQDFSTFTNRYNGGYAKVGIASFYRLRGSFRLNARIENALDRRYAEVLAFPAVGRTLYGGAQFGF